jgi:hypothetical protein
VEVDTNSEVWKAGRDLNGGKIVDGRSTQSVNVDESTRGIDMEGNVHGAQAGAGEE